MRASLFALVLLAAACAPSAEAPAAQERSVASALEPAMDGRQPVSTPDTCGAAQYRALIGANIAAVTFPADSNIRIIQPMTPVTQDFQENRLNVIVDGNGVIISLECY